MFGSCGDGLGGEFVDAGVCGEGDDLDVIREICGDFEGGEADGASGAEEDDTAFFPGAHARKKT